MTLLEKRRPTTLGEIMGQDDHVALFQSWMEAGDIPHLIIHGPFGTGKSSFIEAGLKDYYGDYIKLNSTTKNASQQSVRGIGAMDDIINKELGIIPAGGYPFRIIVFEEAEQITPQGQRSLKRAIEQFAHNTRFIFITNYFEELDEAIRERCEDMKFNIPPGIEQYVWLRDIYTNETGQAEEDIPPGRIAIIMGLSNSGYSPRVSLKKLGTYLTGGKKDDTILLSEKSVLIVARLFGALKDKTKIGKLYGGLMDIYESIRPDFSSPEREMLGYIFTEAKTNYFTTHPTIVGELSKAIAASDIAIRESFNADIHMSNLLWKLSRAFGE